MIITGKELIDMGIKEYPVLVEGLIPKYEMAVIAGGSDIGKSSFLRDMAMSIVERRKTFIGQNLNVKHGRVIYVSSEDGIFALSNCLNRSTEGNDPSIYDNITFILEADNVLNTIKKELAKYYVDAIIVDSYSDMFTNGNMNSANDTRNFLKPFKNLCKEYHCCVVFLHHFSKSRGQTGGNKNALLGSCGMEQMMRAVLTFGGGNKDNVRELQMVKGNDFKSEDKKVVYNLTFEDNQRFSLYEKTTASKNKSEKMKEDKPLVQEIVFELREEREPKTPWTEVERIVREKGFNYGKTKLTEWHKQYMSA